MESRSVACQLFDFDGATGEAFSPSKSVSHEPVGTETEKDDEWNRRRAEGVARNSRPYKLKLAINMSVNVGRFMKTHEFPLQCANTHCLWEHIIQVLYIIIGRKYMNFVNCKHLCKHK